jgi:carbon starvation protein CstA
MTVCRPKIYFYLTGAAAGKHASVHPVFPALFAFFCGNSSGFYSLSDPKLPA